MKYFKQTKETRRMLSFFLSLALMISLIPASNKAAAATATAVFGTKTVTGATVSDLKTTTGGYEFTVTASEGYKFDSEDDVTVEVLDASSTTPESPAPSETNGPASGPAVTDDPSDNTSGASVRQTARTADLANVSKTLAGKVITVTVTNITKDIKINVSGKAVADTPAKKFNYTVNTAIVEGVTTELFVGGTKVTATSGAITENEVLQITISVEEPKAFAKDKAPAVKDGTTVVSAEDGSTQNNFIYKITAKKDINVTIEINSEDIVTPAVLGSTEAAPGSIDNVEVGGIKAPDSIDDVEIKNDKGEVVELTAVEKEAIEKNEKQLVLMLSATTAAPEEETKGNTAATSVKGNESNTKKVVDAINETAGVNVTSSEIDNVNVAKVLDISIKAYLRDLKDTSAKDVEKGTYTKKDNDEVTITLPVADIVSGDAPSGKTRVFYVLHLNDDGTIKEVLNCTIADQKLSFKVKSFSTFVMCYSDITKTTSNGLANYPVSAPAATATPAPTASAAPSASPAASAAPTTSAAPTEPGTGDNTPGGSTGGDTGNTGGNGTVNNPGDGEDDGNTTTTTKKKTISKLKVTAKKNAKQIKVTTIKKAKVVVTVNRKVIKSGKKSVKKATIKAANNKKGNVTVKLSKKLKKGDKITVKVSRSGYKTKSKTVKVK